MKLLNLIFITLALVALYSAITVSAAADEGAAEVADKEPVDEEASPAKKGKSKAIEAEEGEAALPIVTKAKQLAKKVVEAVEDAEGKVKAAAPALVGRTPRSLLQACRKEIARVCPEKKAIVKCLSQKVAEINDEECKTWINARDVCTKAASKNAKCTAKDSPRQCLRKVPTTELPEECTSSDFYKSVKMFSMFRRNPGKGGILGKLGQK